jgi:hypothetical protein
MSRLFASAEPVSEVCSTCRGVLRLQARWTRPQATGEERRQEIARLALQVRWFVLALNKTRPCPSHRGTLRLARHLVMTFEAVEPLQAPALAESIT